MLVRTVLGIMAVPASQGRGCRGPAVARIMRPDMLSAWGVRTLSADHRSSNMPRTSGAFRALRQSTTVVGLRFFALAFRNSATASGHSRLSFSLSPVRRMGPPACYSFSQPAGLMPGDSSRFAASARFRAALGSCRSAMDPTRQVLRFPTSRPCKVHAAPVLRTRMDKQGQRASPT